MTTNRKLLINGGLLFLGLLTCVLIFTQVDPEQQMADHGQAWSWLIGLVFGGALMVFSLLLYVLFFGGELLWGLGKVGPKYFRLCVRRAILGTLLAVAWFVLYWIGMLTWIELVSVLFFFGFWELFFVFQTK